MVRKTRTATRASTASKRAASSAPAEQPEPIPKKRIIVSSRDKQIRKRALSLLQNRPLDEQQEEEQQSDDSFSSGSMVELPVMYAALKRIKEIGPSGIHEEEEDCDLTKAEQALIRDAALAVPYIMYKRVYEHFMVPVTMGGLALSDAKAKSLARDLFVTLGPACCYSSTNGSNSSGGDAMTDQALIDQLTHHSTTAAATLKRVDARKILPFLKIVGQEAKSRLEEIYAQLNEGLGDDAAAVVAVTTTTTTATTASAEKKHNDEETENEDN